MTTEDALLAAIIANPADDLPRLVYADWLEENGRANRAYIIRDPEPQTFASVNGTWAKVCEGGDVHSLNVEHFVAMSEWGVQYWPQGVRFTVRRGFVSEIRCSLADWCGGVCRDCDGDGRVELGGRGPSYQTCVACNATCRTPGIGPQVVRRHPVERVVLTDREPRQVHNGDWVFNGFYPALPNPSRGQYWVPYQVFDLMHGARLSRSDRRYVSREFALSALSAAIILWAKSQPHPARLTTSPVSADLTHV